MNICTLTEQAKQQITKVCQENSIYAVSLDIKGSGCAGYGYEWGKIESTDEVEPESYTLKTIGGNLVIGAASIKYFAGAEIDHVTSMVGSKFEINNPNAESACGCGTSVNFKTDSTNELAHPAK